MYSRLYTTTMCGGEPHSSYRLLIPGFGQYSRTMQRMAGKHVSTFDLDGDDGFRNKPCRCPIHRIRTFASVRTLLGPAVWTSQFLTRTL
jgi:hypothetical protein